MDGKSQAFWRVVCELNLAAGNEQMDGYKLKFPLCGESALDNVKSEFISKSSIRSTFFRDLKPECILELLEAPLWIA